MKITGLNLKISGVARLSKAKLMRDLCLAHKIPMTIEDTRDGDIVTARIADLASSTPAEFIFSAAGRPGLAITPVFDVLGEPVASYA